MRAAKQFLSWACVVCYCKGILEVILVIKDGGSVIDLQYDSNVIVTELAYTVSQFQKLRFNENKYMHGFREKHSTVIIYTQAAHIQLHLQHFLV